ncbi:WD40-repeat-containing domain protein [Phascolomyces articulosus]|uniref:WD40-repeat-containing domain protein n=1 Tax=Phascolomyces articulosus TaxID=60185 RepID=A0AAD5PAP7_9FUNG|nr:WD40-repeat-containing domain protein [Phascolomyces articulosus]
MFSEVAISSSNTDSIIYVWDIRSGSTLFSFKQSTSNKACFTTVPKPNASLQTGTILTAQTDRAVLNVYQWQRDQVLHKMPMPEKLVSIAASHRGDLVAGGTASGRVFLWQISTGLLLKVYEAHFRRITKLAFSGDDATLLTASEDATVHVWLVGGLLEHGSSEDGAGGHGGGRPAPLFSWSDHTLPVTDMYIGSGSMATARVYTASMDNTVKAWDLATGELLTTFLFPKPVSTVIADPSETRLFVACENKIYPVELYRRKFDKTYNADSVESVGGMAKVESIGIKVVDTPSGSATGNEQSEGLVFSDHSGTVTSLALSFDGSLLISASEDGNCIVWDVTSRQPLRKFESHKGPITHVTCILRPSELITGSNRNTSVPMPWKTFKRTLATEEEEQRTESLQLMVDTQSDLQRHQQLLEPGPLYSSISSCLEPIQSAQNSLTQLNAPGSNSALQNKVSALEDELSRLYKHHKKVKSLQDNLHNTIVDQYMTKRRKLSTTSSTSATSPPPSEE